MSHFVPLLHKDSLATITSPCPRIIYSQTFRSFLSQFEAPKGYISKADRKRGVKTTPRIGFNAKGANYALDIEDRLIVTDYVQMSMKRERPHEAENKEIN
ncbi:hypothetical protein HI914_07389 [Erysiphe necator]|nr:hypothetical protein HI914_07389 [Erysiphe necator]